MYNRLSKKSREEMLGGAIPGKVYVKGNGDPFILGHELGHALNERSKNPLRRFPNSGLTTLGIAGTSLAAGYKSGKEQDKDKRKKWNRIGLGSVALGNLTTPIEEYSASQRSLKMLKQLGASKDYIKANQKYARQNNLIYLNPRKIGKNPIVKKKVLFPLAVNGGLYLTGKAIGNYKRRKESE